VEKVSIDAARLLPKNHAYYTFAGSLTTPPCSEGVTWFVLVSPMQVSEAQVARFGKIYSANARPVQPLNGRIVKVSQ
jgi:carbonic anhydrase